jgi:hypothetical protein
VSLRLPSGSPLANAQGTRSGASRDTSATDDAVTVFTAPAKVTKEALRGEEGALRATRIRQADGTTLELEPQPEEPDPDPDGDETDTGEETPEPPRNV